MPEAEISRYILQQEKLNVHEMGKETAEDNHIHLLKIKSLYVSSIRLVIVKIHHI